MNTRNTLAGAVCLLLSSLQPAAATTINYEVSNISGNTWEYNYTVINDTLGIAIEEFTVYFASGLYENLSLESAPASWDPLVIAPNNFLNNDAYYDALALGGAGIAPGASLGLFSVQFDYLGTATPGSQLFEIVNPEPDFSVLASGRTALATVVPIPAAFWLFGTGIIGLIGLARPKVPV